jgi:hypothetical protein
MTAAKKRDELKVEFKALQKGPTSHSPTDLGVKIAKHLSAYQIAEIGSVLLCSDIKELHRIRYDPRSSAIQTWIASVAIKGIARGDAAALNIILNRICGAVKEKIEITGENGGPIMSKIGAMTQEERIKEIERLRKLRETVGDD